MFLKAPRFSQSLQKSNKQFGHSFAFDASTIQDEYCLMMSVLLPVSPQKE